MCKIKSNCHTHTKYCDGKNTAREMIEEAIEKGFSSLGFSGHSPMNFANEWAMTADNTEKYYTEINSLKREYADSIDILCGIELDADYEIKEDYSFDYTISSVHQLHGKNKIYAIDLSAEELTECVNEEFDGDWNKMAGEYYKNLADFVVREKTDVVGHYDLITKFNGNGCLFDENDERYRKTAIYYLDYIINSKPEIVFEVNTGAMFRCGNETPYPADFILKRIAEKGARVTISSDAHCVDALDFMFEKAKKYCKECGIRSLWHLTKNGFIEEKL